MKKDLLKTVFKIFPCLPKTKLSDISAQYDIQHGYPDVAKQFVQACTDKEVVTEARTESYAELLGMDQHSVHAVAIIKNKIDTVDPFYIHKINDRKWNGSGTYIFKSSQTATEIGYSNGQDCKAGTIQRSCCTHGWAALTCEGICYHDIMGQKSSVINYAQTRMHGV